MAKNVTQSERFEQNGFFFEHQYSMLISATYGLRTIRLGQIVVSNGRIFHPRGTKGVVKKIHRPHTEGLTSDIFEVLFKNEKSTSFMKFKDLEL